MEGRNQAQLLGRRLRELRVAAGLRQSDVVQRMGLSRPGSRNRVWKLEKGMIASPGAETLSRFLRACGARGSQLSAVLDLAVLPAVGIPADQLRMLPGPRQRRVQETTKRQVMKYALALPASPPQSREPAGKRFAESRVVANLIGEGVLGVLRETELPLVAYPVYRAGGRHLLGLLWRLVKTPRGRKALADSGAGLPKVLQLKVTTKDADWVEQRLASELVAQVQATVLAWFRELLRQHPELFPDA